jgi:hypothetical protein
MKMKIPQLWDFAHNQWVLQERNTPDIDDDDEEAKQSYVSDSKGEEKQASPSDKEGVAMQASVALI